MAGRVEAGRIEAGEAGAAKRGNLRLYVIADSLSSDLTTLYIGRAVPLLRQSNKTVENRGWEVFWWAIQGIRDSRLWLVGVGFQVNARGVIDKRGPLMHTSSVILWVLVESWLVLPFSNTRAAQRFRPMRNTT
jgi:hypothetical protein